MRYRGLWLCNSGPLLCGVFLVHSCLVLLLYFIVCNYLCFYLLSYVFGYGLADWLSDTVFGDTDAGPCASIRSHVVFGIFLSTINVNWLYRCRENVPLPQSLFILFTVCPFYFQPTSVVEFGLTFLQTAWIWVTFFLFLNACCQSLSWWVYL